MTGTICQNVSSEWGTIRYQEDISMRVMKFSVFVVAVIFAFTAVSGIAEAKVKIGFMLKTMQEERYQKDKDIFTEKAESLGAQVYFDSANNNEQMQNHHLPRFLPELEYDSEFLNFPANSLLLLSPDPFRLVRP